MRYGFLTAAREILDAAAPANDIETAAVASVSEQLDEALTAFQA